MGDGGGRRLDGYEVLLCLSGGIACYKSADLASKLVQAGAGVSVAMTEAACQFVQPLTLQALTHRPVFTSLWQSAQDYNARHLGLTARADLMVIAPATADILAKMACGLADELVSTLALSACGACEILVAPTMNTRMYQAPPTQANLARLKGWGVQVIGPESGPLACGELGPGRMSEPADILERIASLLLARPAKGLAS